MHACINILKEVAADFNQVKRDITMSINSCSI